MQVRKNANRLVGTVPDLFYEQILDNLARTVAQPGSIPYFATPTQGTQQNSRQFQASYTPGWDFITASPGMGFFGRWLFDKQMAGFQGQATNQQTFQLQPLIDPDKLFYLQTAMRIAVGDSSVLFDDVDDLHDLYEFHRDSSTFSEVYFYAITGIRIENYKEPEEEFKYLPWQDSHVLPWLKITTDKRQIPKDACYVGHYCDVWVWVDPGATKEFSLFTLAILDIVTRTPEGGDGPTKVDFAPGALWHSMIPGAAASDGKTTGKGAPSRPLRPRMSQFPYPAPP
jgi:hypothetical protein